MTKKKPVGYGFALDYSKIDPTVCKISNYAHNFPIFSRILFGSLAWEAGISSGDYLLQVNGISVESMKEGAVVNLIQQNLRSVELMVATMSNKLKKSAETAASSPLAAPYIKNSVVNITQQQFQPQATTPTQRHKPQKQPSMRSNFGIYEEINIYCEEHEIDANGFSNASFNKNDNINKNNIPKPQQSPKEFSNNQKKHEPSGNQLQQNTETAVLSIHDDDVCSPVMPSIKLPSLTIGKMQKSKNNLKGTTGNQNESADEDAFDNVARAIVGNKKNTSLSSPTSPQQSQIAEQLNELSSISSPTATTSTALRKVSCSESSGFVSESAENSSDGSLPSSTSSDNTFNHCTDNCNGNTSNDCNNIFNKNFDSAINDKMMKPMLPTPNTPSKIHQITSQLHQHKQQQQLPAPDVAPPIPPKIKNPVQTEKTSEMKKLHNLISRCQDDADKQNVEKTFQQYLNSLHDQLRQTNHNTHNYATNFMQQPHLKVSRKPLPPLPPTQLSLSLQSEIFRPQNQTFFQKENKMKQKQACCLLHNDTDQTPIKSRKSDSETSRSVEAIDPTSGIVAPPDEFSAGNNNRIDGCKPTRPSFLDLTSQTSFLSPTKTSFSPVCSANISSSPSIPIPKPTYLFNRLSNNFIITTPNNYSTFPSNDSNITAEDEDINNTNIADDNNNLDVHNSAENRLNCKQIEQWSVDDVCTWLLHVGFDSYEDSFRKHSIKGEGMLKLKRLDLIKLGMEDVVARRDFQRAVVRVQLRKYDESSC
ncbi:hypothetical protein HELRODRAFT_160322 [Helobdella robusta]|uniref:SAM domain-containing protein n=1 Tax=Helobdella robusta TaxID=6412 RepID=T1EQ36_HELRO|nr:hypothetical protein HELRODRAFT_160322 [Helobdella robusta]ESO06170.1 hypothetical protein HELRODRAFT_160322 [Helobdella robusta]